MLGTVCTVHAVREYHRRYTEPQSPRPSGMRSTAEAAEPAIQKHPMMCIPHVRMLAVRSTLPCFVFSTCVANPSVWSPALAQASQRRIVLSMVPCQGTAQKLDCFPDETPGGSFVYAHVRPRSLDLFENSR
ncbi:hypothetical protein VTN00DRAFT_1868 [Thermoascus crustaceus]|uniref:uncharacterized protein n=1 Tax=Thermoascus crustaceus TaxID=5088 RepID=UPI0037447BC1